MKVHIHECRNERCTIFNIIILYAYNSFHCKFCQGYGCMYLPRKVCFMLVLS